VSGRARTGASALLAAAGLAVSAYLAAHQLGLVGRVWDPVFGAASSAAVLGSALSGALPAPDALLGAAAYAAEVVLAVAVLAGAGRPAVLAYGALAAGMGLVGLGLVATQALLVHHFCLLCLASAGLSWAVAALAVPEAARALGARRGRAAGPGLATPTRRLS
jgi:uncharacterized membrane protein